MEQLIAAHPDLKEIIVKHSTLKTYRIIDVDKKIVECWEKNKQGHWTDVTEREKLKEEIAEQKEELERIHRAELKAKEKANEQSIIEGQN